MARDWEATFDGWGRPPSQTEQEEIARVERQIREALDSSTKLSNRTLRVYPKGSHRRGTNVRRGSDVDMAVELRGVRGSDSWVYDKDFRATNVGDAELGIRPIPASEAAQLHVDEFKKDVHEALVARFGARAVTWHNKCIQIREGVTSLPADIVPCRYYKRFDGPGVVNEGISIQPGSWARHHQLAEAG